MVAAERVNVDQPAPEGKLSGLKHKIGSLKIILNEKVKDKIHIHLFPCREFQGVLLKEFTVNNFFGKGLRVCHYEKTPLPVVQPVQHFGPQQ